MKKLKNFSVNKIIFRCDAGNISGLGTGHVYRSVNIANFLTKKFKLKKKQVCFLTKYQDEFKSGFDIIKKNGYKINKVKKFVSDYSKEEVRILNKYKSNLLVIDRLGKVNLEFISKIKNNFKKKIILEDSSVHRKEFDLSINALVRNIRSVKNSKIGFQYMILRIKKNSEKINLKKEKIFLFFGGFDKKRYSVRILKNLNKLGFRLNINVPEIYKNNLKKIKTDHKLIYFNNKNYLKKMRESNIVICSGGLILFDSILMNKKIICLPQHDHQKNNANELHKKSAIHYFSKLNKDKFLNFLLKIYDNRSYEKKVSFIQRRIINLKKIRRNYSLISKVYEQSIS